MDDDLIKNKVVFSSFHQTKGLERKVVFVFGFDKSYFTFYDPDHPWYHCPNVLYVALTRAKEHLVLFHHYKFDYIPFLNKPNYINSPKYTVVKN